MAISFTENMDCKIPNKITWKQLYKTPEKIHFPFYLAVKDSRSPIRLEKILRLIRKKRIVFQGWWEGTAVVIKLFIEPRRASLHQHRELTGIKSLIDSGTPTAKLLYHGLTERYHLPILITEYLHNTKDLEEIWRHHKTNSSRLMRAVTIELATQHVSGILQTDLHFQNLLIKNHQIYSLDGDTIESFEQPLSRKISFKHLALFFAQLGVGTEKLQANLLQIYTKSRGWHLRKSDYYYISKMTEKYFNKRLTSYQKKIMRNNTNTKFISKFCTRIWHNKKHESLEFDNFIEKPDSIFQKTNIEYLKQGRSATIAKININNTVFVIKRYNIKNPLHWLRRCLRTTRGLHSWQLSHMLELAGIATARPIACIEKHFFGLRGKSYFMMEHINGTNLADFFMEYNSNQPKFKRVAQRVVALIKQLHSLDLIHGDLKATNFIIEHDRPVLIDLDGIKKSNNSKKDLQRFMKNWKDQPDIHNLFKQFI